MSIEVGQTVYFSTFHNGIIHKAEYLGEQEHVSWAAPGRKVQIIDNFGDMGFPVGYELSLSPKCKIIKVDPHLDQSVDQETIEWVMNHHLEDYMLKVVNNTLYGQED